MSHLTKAEQRRREFLGGMVAGGTATALLAMGVVAESEPETPPASTSASASEQKTKGYHVTSHIRTYYEKAQI